jgi:hypothetical protein
MKGRRQQRRHAQQSTRERDWHDTTTCASFAVVSIFSKQGEKTFHFLLCSTLLDAFLIDVQKKQEPRRMRTRTMARRQDQEQDDSPFFQSNAEHEDESIN